MAAQRVTPFHRKVRNSEAERMSRALIFSSGTGDVKGVAGVKTVKLCAEQEQIGKRLNAASIKFSGCSLKEFSNKLFR